MKRTILLLISFCLSLAVRADQPFRNHRYDSFKVLTVDSTQIVFIGNSITNMHEWCEAFPDHRVINRGVSGAVSDEVLANLKTILAGKPAKAFLMIGTNDLATSGINNAAHVARNVRTILQRFREESPRTQLYLQSILPSRLRPLALLQEANDSLRNICKEMQVPFVDLWGRLISVSQDDTHTLDGLHLTASGYAIWCNAIAEAVGIPTVYGATIANQSGGLPGSFGMRASYFAALPVRDGDVLFIGDETVHSGEWHELLNCPRIKNRGTGWGLHAGNMAVVAAELPLILRGRSDNGTPAQLLFYAGAGEVADTSLAIDSVLTTYTKLVQSARQLSPTSSVVLVSVLPGVTSPEILERARRFNAGLRAYAETSDGITFVDCFSSFYSNGVADSNCFQNGYLSGYGYAKLAQMLAPLIGPDAHVEVP